MELSGFSSVFILTIFSCLSLRFSQQPYEGESITACSNKDGSNSVLGYTCNGVKTSCQAYLTFRSQPPYDNVSAIADLLASDPSQISLVNLVSKNFTFETNRLVIVPVNCSCSGELYQANTSYVIQHGDIFLSIANSTFQGLSTCQAIGNQNNNLTTRLLYTGTRISVPLRCACPTKNQTDLGLNYLVSYLVAKGDFVYSIATRFGSDTGWTLVANGLSEENPTIYPFTTLLVPLKNPPSGPQILEPSPPPPPSPPSSPPVSSAEKSSKKTWLYPLIGVVGGSVLLLVLGTIIFCRVFHKSKKKPESNIVSKGYEAQETSVEEKVEEESHDFLGSLDIAQSLKFYNFEELQLATSDFNPSCWIKGSVYRGTINGDMAAIKKMHGDVSKEVHLLQKINHSNLIRLSGVCFSEGHWYLVYEYAANGPLSDWIYNDNNDGNFLNWTQRIQIALDVATGLNYLHNFTSPPHVHKDMKSSNILLDSDFRAKIANFGLARSAGAQEGQFSLTNHIVGTVGYMAPEYLENGLVSTRLDVYAFGVLLLEILTGKEIHIFYDENINLSNALSGVLNDEGQESLSRFMDPSMQEKYPHELAKFVVQVIDSCLEKNPEARPTMDEIVQFLKRTLSNSLAWELSNSFTT
ncbi:LysM receptor kinase [Parasponia andersonii]|uniref:LysM receptor kinase n=1 Tax=Parasponia andersonii TaxID=3476 RepID=A0A2P5ALN6_PARAD|nr:LysM receptor kinase [Parasponia andersonii]